MPSDAWGFLVPGTRVGMCDRFAPLSHLQSRCPARLTISRARDISNGLSSGGILLKSPRSVKLNALAVMRGLRHELSSGGRKVTLLPQMIGVNEADYSDADNLCDIWGT